jgi:hypothetical protein
MQPKYAHLTISLSIISIAAAAMDSSQAKDAITNIRTELTTTDFAALLGDIRQKRVSFEYISQAATDTTPQIFFQSPEEAKKEALIISNNIRKTHYMRALMICEYIDAELTNALAVTGNDIALQVRILTCSRGLIHIMQLLILKSIALSAS